MTETLTERGALGPWTYYENNCADRGPVVAVTRTRFNPKTCAYTTTTELWCVSLAYTGTGVDSFSGVKLVADGTRTEDDDLVIFHDGTVGAYRVDRRHFRHHRGGQGCGAKLAPLPRGDVEHVGYRLGNWWRGA